MKNRILTCILAVIMAFSVAACGSQSNAYAASASHDDNQTEEATILSKINSTAWQYNSDDNVYYQIGINYCENPVDTTYETLAIFVPGAYMNATANGDGTFTCEINTSAKVGNYTADIAPIVMPISTPGYSARTALTSYSS